MSRTIPRRLVRYFRDKWNKCSHFLKFLLLAAQLLVLGVTIRKNNYQSINNRRTGTASLLSLTNGELSKKNTSGTQDAAFETVKPTLVMIMSYERSGSTFLGEIFNQNDQSFYFYEPLRFWRRVHPFPRELPTKKRFSIHEREIFEIIFSCRLHRLNPGVLDDFINQSKRIGNRALKEYTECPRNCTQIAKKICEKSVIRGIKEVRTTMEAIKLYLQRNPKLKIIHLLRDPRGVFVSLVRSNNFQFSRIKKAAKHLCGRMYQDVKIARDINARFPNAILTVRYEDLTENPIGKVQQIYRFLGQPLPQNIHSWLTKNTASNKKIKESQFGTFRANSKITAYAWRKTIAYKYALQVDEQCDSGLYKAMGYLPVRSERDLRNTSFHLTTDIETN